MLLTRHVDANATLVSLIEGLTSRDGFSPTHLPGVQVLRASCDVARGPQIYEPSLMFVAQGSKVAYLGPRTLEYGAGHYLIQAMPVPFECETFAMAPSAPLLGVTVGIDRVVLGELVMAMGMQAGPPPTAQTLESMSSVSWMTPCAAASNGCCSACTIHWKAGLWARRGCANYCSLPCAARRPMCCVRWWNSKGSSRESPRR